MNTKPQKDTKPAAPAEEDAENLGSVESVGKAAKPSTDTLPRRLEKDGEKVQFRINEDGSITKEWYTDRQRMNPTSMGHKVEIKKIGADHKAHLIDYGWWGMQEMKDSYGRVIDRVESNFIGNKFEHGFTDIPSALAYIIDWIEDQDKKNAQRAG